jgi:hypothetical protein
MEPLENYSDEHFHVSVSVPNSAAQDCQCSLHNPSSLLAMTVTVGSQRRGPLAVLVAAKEHPVVAPHCHTASMGGGCVISATARQAELKCPLL